ncbi:MAG: FAD-binding oxidoreductase [Rhodovarius sp.]|nr:FAD-binding oxidoreductase [Rhodovarius sp.]MCX7931493.1 FAD-binding oxidoreductase [Rhodovarius sp.]MDW8314947.1 FAD-binding oxidoreductase [Rhodovarius sp.]
MTHVVVIGAGIVGACVALATLARGMRVTILDPGEPGGEQAASYGNGCWINPLSVIPPALPGTWRKVPHFLRDPLGPLAIRWAYLPRAAPWLWRYLRAGWSEERVTRTAHALRALLRDAPDRHLALARRAGCEGLIERRGLLYVYPDRAAFAAEALAWRIRRAVGCSWRELEEEELRQLEPAVSTRYRFGVYVPEAAHCPDPGALVAALIAQAEAEGARRLRLPATGLSIAGGRLRAVRTPGGEIAADRAVIAAGAHSRPLARAAGDDVPLESERGYHAEIAAPEVAPRIPFMPSDGKMSIVHSRGGLRAAGQVEIAGLTAPPNWDRARILGQHLLRAVAGMPEVLPAERMRVWLGHRPSLPDGLPCLGPAAATPDVLLAFGHGHIGLAAGPASGEMLGRMLAGETVPEAEPFSPARFR